LESRIGTIGKQLGLANWTQKIMLNLLEIVD